MSGMPNNISGEQLELLIQIAARRMGQDPDRLRQMLASGGAQQLLGNLNPQQAQQVGQLLSNPKAMEQFLNSPQARKLMSELLGGR